MRSPCSSKPATAVGLAMVVSALILGGTKDTAADTFPAPDPTKVPVMTIKIYNNDTKYNIYPVLTTGGHFPVPDKFLQAYFKIKAVDLPNNPFNVKSAYRFYINPTGTGIPPGKHVVVQIPLLTQLVAGTTIDSKTPDQLIDWWGGGRIEVFDAPVGSGQPPVALQKLLDPQDWPSQKSVSGIPANQKRPTCVRDPNLDDDLANNVCAQNGVFPVYSDSLQFQNNEPSQTFEFTLGAVPDTVNPTANDPAYKLVTNNVDIDISYVDIAYLPGALAPYNPDVSPLSQSGYVGSVGAIDDFRAVLQRFLTSPQYKGWPQYKNRQGQLITKIASPLHAAGSSTDAGLSPPPWPPLDKARAEWDRCTKDKTDLTQPCVDRRDVRDMFTANYNYYFKGFADNPTCKGDPVKPDNGGNLFYAHVQGFTPFAENCDSGAFQLYNTPGYADTKDADGNVTLGKFHIVKAQFDRLQYDDYKPHSQPDKVFSAYPFLIHDDSWLNIPNAYAYSVDDAVGNLQADGIGFIIAIGGTKGLPNPNPATSPVVFTPGYGKTDAVKFTRYGICTKNPKTPVNPDYTAVTLYLLQKTFRKCLVSYKDNKGTLYYFRLKTLPPFKYLPNIPDNFPTLHLPIDCSDNTAGSLGDQWCQGIHAFSEKNNGRGPDFHKIIAPAPKQSARTPGPRRVSVTPR